MAKKYCWLKLNTDFFSSRSMKKLRRIAGGDTYTVIYLRLQLMSLKDEGRLYFEGVEETFEEELALMLDEETEDVAATLCFLKKVGLLETVSEHEYYLTEVASMVGSETDKAELMRKKRLKDKLTGNNVTPALPPVTECYTEIEKDKEKIGEEEKEKYKDEDGEKIEEKDKEKYEAEEKPKEKDKNSEKKENPSEEGYLEVAELFNSVCCSLAPVRSLTKLRKKKIDEMRECLNGSFGDYFRKVENSDFLTGRNGNWCSGENRANFDWVMKPDNFKKVMSGIYDNTIVKSQALMRKKSLGNESLEWLRNHGSDFLAV